MVYCERTSLPLAKVSIRPKGGTYQIQHEPLYYLSNIEEETLWYRLTYFDRQRATVVESKNLGKRLSWHKSKISVKDLPHR